MTTNRCYVYAIHVNGENIEAIQRKLFGEGRPC